MVADGQQAEETALPAKDKLYSHESAARHSPQMSELQVRAADTRFARETYVQKMQLNATANAIKSRCCMSRFELRWRTLQQNSNYSPRLFVFEGQKQGGIWLLRKHRPEKNPFQFAKCQCRITDI